MNGQGCSGQIVALDTRGNRADRPKCSSNGYYIVISISKRLGISHLLSSQVRKRKPQVEDVKIPYLELLHRFGVKSPTRPSRNLCAFRTVDQNLSWEDFPQHITETLDVGGRRLALNVNKLRTSKNPKIQKKKKKKATALPPPAAQTYDHSSIRKER